MEYYKKENFYTQKSIRNKLIGCKFSLAIFTLLCVYLHKNWNVAIELIIVQTLINISTWIVLVYHYDDKLYKEEIAKEKEEEEGKE